MAATSETQIANLALTRLGHYELSSLATDQTKEGRVMRAHYEPTRDLLLRAHPWNWAIARATLAASSTAPNHEYTYAYPLPDDFLKMVNTYNEIGVVTYFDAQVGQYIAPDQYRIEIVGGQRCIVTDESTCSIEYVSKVTDVAQFDPLFVDLLAQRLACEVCYPITQNSALNERLWQIFEMKWRDATSSDAQEGTARDMIADAWIAARF